MALPVFQRATDAVYRHLGEDVEFRPATGAAFLVRSIIEQRMLDRDGAFEMHWIWSARRCDIPVTPRRGDRLIVRLTGSKYRIEAPIEENTDDLQMVFMIRPI